ncbi:hypothetical protein HDA40_001637 [Hamadaea flava]|uniref:PPE family protein n=1 Tax=Hamadaea flava TaxID=1742688 RepID=A0ABV8LMS7_9ACTN|nr:hypothetical protein [Hamadaea flava]MCP2323130.1 hypothetical protein [Hamadaea flava]
MVPYNFLPIETHLAMVTAQNANVAALTDAARMWTQVREWIAAAEVELHVRAADLLPHWPDEAGRELERETQRTLAELKMWGERIDASQVVAGLGTLAAAVPASFQIVSGLHQSYLAALSNPLTAWAALGFQQASGAEMTALGGLFDTTMLQVCSAAGIRTPNVSIGPASEGNSTDDVVTAVESVTSAVTSLQGLVSAAGVSANLSDLSGLTGDGLSLSGADLIPNLPGGSLPGVDSAPTVSVPGGSLGAAVGTPTLPAAVRTLAGRRAVGVGPELSVAATAAGASASAAGMTPPMVPPGAARAADGTLRPVSASSPTGRARRGEQPVDGTGGVPRELRGRSGSGDQSFGTAKARGSRDPQAAYDLARD